MFLNLAQKIFGSSNERIIKNLRPHVAAINALEPSYTALSDEQLRAKTLEFRQQIENGAPLDSLMHDAFATVREAAKRSLGMRHYRCSVDWRPGFE
jgi:preprotein translocase subunit SecA